MSEPALETDDDTPRNRAEAALMAASAQDVGLGIAFERRGHVFPREASDARIALFGHLRRLCREARETQELLIGLEALANWATMIIEDERDAIAEAMSDMEVKAGRSLQSEFREEHQRAMDEIELRNQFLATAEQLLSSIRS
ncbi:hypothetical protein [Palleronia sp.]|uniref:hypothetical protein n=1 Tax=Palleronia sp. TaxID=1940284 RepID=UPI0035C78BAD